MLANSQTDTHRPTDPYIYIFITNLCSSIGGGTMNCGCGIYSNWGISLCNGSGKRLGLGLSLLVQCIQCAIRKTDRVSLVDVVCTPYAFNVGRCWVCWCLAYYSDPGSGGAEYYYDSVCMFVCMCPSVCLRTYHRNSMSMQSSPNFSRVLPMAVTRFSSDGVAICDMLCSLLLVLWIGLTLAHNGRRHVDRYRRRE